MRHLGEQDIIVLLKFDPKVQYVMIKLPTLILLSRRCSDGYESATFLYIGQERVRFMVYEALICPSPKYFGRALRCGFLEHRRKSAELPEESIKVFALLVHWLYTGQIYELALEEYKKYRSYQRADKRSLDHDLRWSS